MPIGSRLYIIADDNVDARVRPGSEFRAHLRDPLAVGGTLVGTAGTPARIIVTSKDAVKDGTARYHIAITGLDLGVAGTLPVKPDQPVVERIMSGTSIAVTTLASIGLEAGKMRVVIPLPVNLSNDPPSGSYTPSPLRTAAPIVPRRRPTPKPSPSPSPLPSNATPAVSPEASPAVTPSAGSSGAASPAASAPPR